MPLISGSGQSGQARFEPVDAASARQYLTGPVTISGGVIYAGNNALGSVASIPITNNATLDLGGGTFSGNKPITVSGSGFNGEGAIFNSYERLSRTAN